MSTSSRGRWVYLAFYAANAALLPVLTLYYESVGVHGARLGVLAAIWPAGSVLGASLWGAIADATGRHRFVLSSTIIASALLAQLLYLGDGFLALVPIVTVFALSVAPVGPMLDHSVLLDLGARQERFGRVRLWGAIGWGVAAPLVGLLIDRTSLVIAFPVYGALMLVLLVTSVRLPVPRTSIGTGIFAGFARIAGDRSWRFFLLLVLAAGTGSAFVHHYLFIYLAEIGGTGTVRGLALAVATLSELLIFGLADRILRRVRPRLLIVIAMAAAGLRMVAMGLIADPWLALLPQLLHGASFSLLLIAGVDIARRMAPDGMGATAQALFSGTHMGAGGIAGALIGGVLYRTMPVSRVYLVAGIGEIVLVALFLAGLRMLRPTQRSNV